MRFKKRTLALSLIAASVFTNTYGQNKNTYTADSLTYKEKMKKVNAEPNFIFQAARYTKLFPELGITVIHGRKNTEDFNIFKDRLSEKLTEKGIPHKFFTDITDEKTGYAFAYFVNGRQHGIFNVEEFVAMLPEAVRDFKKAHPKEKLQTLEH
ncbi:hypothetical protein [Tenacibaculum agarivorans]|uniref:hypothetical protein n=1 Tax=Tenacibaculum agarivorans TaxID=1908389 RepID=UPI00094B9651|nr:hypothetical protein [Tenacibaculum agarivorans]